MKNNLLLLQEIVYRAASEAGFKVKHDEIRIERARTPKYGHFATNLAMALSKKTARQPREIAAQIMDHIKDPLVQKTETAGPGFINLWIEQKFYTDECRSALKNAEKYARGALEIKPGDKRIVIEYSSPNIAKPLGAHHLLSTVIGDALKRIFKAYGYYVVAENFPGDMGTQFGKLMTAIHKWGDERAIEKNPIEELLKLYVRFHEEAEKDPSLEEEGRAEFRKFEEGDPLRRTLWRKIKDWSMKEIQPLYDRLGVSFDAVHGESFFEEGMKKILEEGRRKGVFVDGNDGAWIVPADNPDNPPAVVRKSDGATLYLTRDLAQMDFFEKTYHPDIVAWVVDVAQAFYFKQRFEVYRKLRRAKTEFVHVIFGRMDFKDKTMSTRRGNIIRLSEILDEAESRALTLAKEKGSDLSADEQKELARIMGIGAVKYNILSQNRLSNITFDWDTMLSFDGNSAPYLMYTAARSRSVFRKGGLDVQAAGKFSLGFTDVRETDVALDLVLYPEAIRRAAEEFKPNHIANYLYNLAQDFNALYNDLPILKADEDSRKTRLLLTGAVLSVMAHGLSLLGIEMPEKM